MRMNRGDGVLDDIERQQCAIRMSAYYISVIDPLVVQIDVAELLKVESEFNDSE